MMIKIRCNRALSTLSCVRASKTSIFTFLISLVAVSIVSGQTAQRKPLATEPLERYDNPPAYIFRLETSPRMISQFGPFTSFQVNVDANGNNIVGDAANEPSIAVDPTNLSKMVIGWRQFNSLQSNFRQGGLGADKFRYTSTSDGGTTWTFPSVLENNVFRSDPVLGSDGNREFFLPQPPPVILRRYVGLAKRRSILDALATRRRRGWR